MWMPLGVLVTLLLCGCALQPGVCARRARPPNVFVLLTDDQDAVLESTTVEQQLLVLVLTLTNTHITLHVVCVCVCVNT